EDGHVVSFVSASHDGVEATLNRGFALPPGFTVEVETEGHVAELFDRAESADARVIEPFRDERPQFSVLDPSGRRVTITAADHSPLSAVRDTNSPIARAIPGSVIEAAAAKRFYGDYLGMRVRREWPGVVMFESA